MYKIIAFAFMAAVSCNDLMQGPEGGRKIYDENMEASPAIWKQINEVTVKANDSEVISRIVVKDLRPSKDGEVKIIEGGQGHKNVTVELKSPTIFRGYDFHIEVYATEDNGQQIAYPKEKGYPEESAYPEEVLVHTEEIPAMENDTRVNPAKNDGNITKSDEITTESDKISATEWTTTEGKVMGQDKVEVPVTHEIKSRNTEEASVDKIVQYVNENKTEINAVTQKSTITSFHQTPNMPQRYENSPNLHAWEDEKFKTDGPNVHENSHEVKADSTTETMKVVTESHKANPKAFRDISEELGEDVVFAIKRV